MGTEGVQPDYIRLEILPEFFRNFWVRRMALDRRNYRQLVETTVEIANKVPRDPSEHCKLVHMICCHKFIAVNMSSFEREWHELGLVLKASRNCCR